jgi:hypothetical protein
MFDETERKPFLTWSAEEVTRLLTDSPWISHSVYAATGQTAFRRSYYWRIRLLTAAPIRQAYLRYLSLVPDLASSTVDYRKLKSEQTPEWARSRYERFVAAHPDDIRLKNDNEYIVISVNETWHVRGWHGGEKSWPPILAGPELWPPVVENTRPGLLMSLRLSDLAQTTVLSTDSGQKLALVRYDAPSHNHYMGALFYFRRPLENVKWIRPGDEELRFVTTLGGKDIKAIFNLQKLRFGGRLEY